MTPPAWALAALLIAAPARASESPEVRVALVSYGEAPTREVEALEPLARRLKDLLRGKARVSFAFGTYADVIAWVEAEKVDAAVVTAGVLGYLNARAEKSGSRTWRYLGSDRSAEQSRSVCVTRKGSGLASVTALKDRPGGVEFLFVDPLSVSGRILPQSALKRAGVRVASRDIAYTSSHGTSLGKLLAEKDAGPRVACVWDKLLTDPGERAKFDVLDLPGLASAAVPPDSLLAVGPPSAVLAAAARAAAVPDPAWKERAAEVWRSFEAVEELDQGRFLTRISLDGLASLLVGHRRTYGAPPRLAVVFSGGGAKCSYQVGAIRAIEERLERLRREYDDKAMDIGLVVGTSGGAINAVAVALGGAGSPEGFAGFAKIWEGLDQRRIIRPSFAVRANMGLWFTALEDLALLVLVMPFLGPKRRSPSWWGRLLLVVGGLQLLISALPLKPWWFFGENAAAHHAFLWAGWGISGAGAAQCLCGALVAFLYRGGRRKAPREEFLWAGLVVLALGLPLLQTLRILWGEPTLSGNIGIRELVAEKFPLLMGREPLARGVDLDQAARELSREVIERGLLRHDLALTGSRLAQEGSTVPADLYFYAAADPAGPAPKFGDRGVSLRQRPELLFDAMMGSGAIYPVFPARTLKDFPSAGQSADIVDGSFSHRSPIEAAVLWGATHIVVLEASPEEVSPRGSFAANIGAALNHLYDQAQLLDQYSKQHVTTLTLYPSPPHIGLLDFSGNLIAASIKRGYEETQGRGAAGWAPFRKEAGEPRFLRLGP